MLNFRTFQIALLCLCFLSTGQLVSGQSKKAATQKFLQSVNQVLRHSSHHHWAYAEAQMKVDSPLAVSATGYLSVTLRYFSDSGFHRIRMEAPIGQVQRVVQDYYLILEYESNLVQWFESELNQETLVPAFRSSLFHLGIIGDDLFLQAEFQQKMDALLRFYPR